MSSESEAAHVGRPEDHYYAVERAKPRQRECPDCGGPLIKRTSVRQGALCREINYQCDNLVCGASFKGYEELAYRMKVPALPNPLVRLPVSRSQAHAAPGGSGRDCCPACGSRVHKQLVATDDPLRFVAYVECSRNGCDWGATGFVNLRNSKKPGLTP